MDVIESKVVGRTKYVRAGGKMRRNYGIESDQAVYTEAYYYDDLWVAQHGQKLDFAEAARIFPVVNSEGYRA